MEVILKEDLAGLGYKHDLVTVKAGYGRNYLIPKGFAIVASDSNKKMMAENARQAEHKAEKMRQDAQDFADSIGDITLELGAKVGESGKIFGAITTLQISGALKDKGFEVDKKQITFKSAIKMIGDYEVELDLHREVKHPLKIKVVAD